MGDIKHNCVDLFNNFLYIFSQCEPRLLKVERYRAFLNKQKPYSLTTNCGMVCFLIKCFVSPGSINTQ